MNAYTLIDSLTGAANYIDTLGGDSTKYRQLLSEPLQPVTTEQLAERLTRALFALGDAGGPEGCGRIQFMLGRYNVDERPGGGLNKEACQRFLTGVLDGSLKYGQSR